MRDTTAQMHVPDCLPFGGRFGRGSDHGESGFSWSPESRHPTAPWSSTDGTFRAHLTNVEKSGRDSDLHCAAIFTFILGTNGTRRADLHN